MTRANRPRTGAAAYQRQYRTKQKTDRTPSRDDVARLALHLMITEALRRDREDEMFRFLDIVADLLVKQGFDRLAVDTRIEDLVDRYQAGWDFQRKPHLRLRDAD